MGPRSLRLRAIAFVLFAAAIAPPLQAQAWKFTTLMEYAYPKHTGTMGGGVAAADFDGDGLRDIIVVGISGTAKKAILYLNKGASLAPVADCGLPGLDAGCLIAWADFDGDGDTDIVLAGRTGVDAKMALFDIYLNDGKGRFSVGPRLGPMLPAEDVDPGEGKTSWPSTDAEVLGFDNALGFSDGCLIAADVDGDGDADIVMSGRKGMEARPPVFGFPVTIRDWETAAVFLNDGKGGFSIAGKGRPDSCYAASGILKANRGSGAAADLNGDGKLDLVIAGQRNSGPDPNDTDGDGKPNMYPEESQRDPEPVTEIFLGNGDGTFAKAGSIIGLMDGAMALGDVDGDRDIDLVAMGSTGSTGDPAGGRYLGVWLNDGKGRFVEDGRQAELVGAFSGDLDLGDLDGDGDLDLVVTGNDNTRSIRIYENRGGVFALKILTKAANGIVTYAKGAAAPAYSMDRGDVLLVDMDGDGDLDIVLNGNASASSLVVFRNCLK